MEVKKIPIRRFLGVSFLMLILAVGAVSVLSLPYFMWHVYGLIIFGPIIVLVLLAPFVVISIAKKYSNQQEKSENGIPSRGQETERLDKGSRVAMLMGTLIGLVSISIIVYYLVSLSGSI